MAGSDFIAQHGANNRQGNEPDSHIIAPGGDDDLAWGQYVIAGFDTERPLSSAVGVATVIAPGGDDDLPMLYWFGVYNYTQDFWDWLGPFDDTEPVILNSTAIRERYVSADNELNFIVLTDCSDIEPSTSNPEGITAVEIITTTTVASTDYFTTKPHFVEVTGISLGDKIPSALDPGTQYVTITWNHVIDTSDPKNEALRYKLYRKLADDPAEPLHLIDVDAPRDYFVDPADIPAEPKHLVPGATYMYYVTAINIGGPTPMLPAGPITIPFYAPTELSASDGEYDDKIVLTWEKAEGAEEYWIYRDSQESVPEIVGDVDTWIDANVGSGEAHEYWVRSVNEYATSGMSIGDTGSTL